MARTLSPSHFEALLQELKSQAREKRMGQQTKIIINGHIKLVLDKTACFRKSKSYKKTIFWLQSSQNKRQINDEMFYFQTKAHGTQWWWEIKNHPKRKRDSRKSRPPWSSRSPCSHRAASSSRTKSPARGKTTEWPRFWTPSSTMAPSIKKDSPSDPVSHSVRTPIDLRSQSQVKSKMVCEGHKGFLHHDQ